MSKFQCVLAYRSSRHEATGVTPAELYFARDLRLSDDLLKGSPLRLEMSKIQKKIMCKN